MSTTQAQALAAIARRPMPQPHAAAWDFTEVQRQARALQEIAMRSGKLRRLPTVFADLDDLS